MHQKARHTLGNDKVDHRRDKQYFVPKRTQAEYEPRLRFLHARRATVLHCDTVKRRRDL